VDLDRWIRLVSAPFLYAALDDRLSFRDALQKALRKPVPGHALGSTWCAGGITLLLFVNQVVTGVLLAVYYKPAAGAAYESVRFIENEVPVGWLLRQMHAWGANLMVFMLFVHMARVFFNKAYRPPRELTWMSGGLLLTVTLAFAFTGYLLPWDQLSYWASTVGSGMAELVPVVGKHVLVMMRGGEAVSGQTLSRFFTLHCIVLPWVTVALVAAHAMLIRRLGISDPL
jgi:quinol-cytochrome oxidoreductase complex cytochrome b subunit